MVAPIIVDTITYSSLYILLSLGLTLTYMTTRVPNFAHASFAVIGSYIMWTWVTSRVIGSIESAIDQGLSPREINMLIREFTLQPTDYLVVLLLSFILVGLVGLAQYLLVLRPLSNRGSTLIGLMIATIAVDMLIFSFINIYADYAQVHFNTALKDLSQKAGYRIPFLVKSRDFTFYAYDRLKDLGVQGSLILFPSLALGLLLVLHVLLTKTKTGIALRASVENPMLAEVTGINVNRIYALAWFVSAGLAGCAGALIPLRLFTNPALGQILIVSIFAASIVGGLNVIYGAFLGGLLVGVSETLIMNFLTLHLGLNAGYRPMIPLLIMSITLLLLPEGIGGYDWSKLKKRVRALW